MSRPCVQGCVLLGPHEECLFRLSSVAVSGPLGISGTITATPVTTQGKTRGVNAAYEAADAEYVVQQVAKHTLPGASVVATCDRMVRLLVADDERARTRMPLPRITAPAASRPECAATPDNGDCWTVSIGAIPHRLGGMPEACLTCAAKRAEDRSRRPDWVCACRERHPDLACPRCAAEAHREGRE